MLNLMPQLLSSMNRTSTRGVAGTCVLALLTISLSACCAECPPPPEDETTAPATQPVSLTAPVAMSISVKGMHCDGCEGAICGKVEKIAGVTPVKASHVSESVEVTAPPEQRTMIVEAIKRLGYTVE